MPFLLPTKGCQVLPPCMQYHFLNESELLCNIVLRISNVGKNMQCKGLAKFLTDSRYQSMALRLPRGRSLTRRPGRLKEEMSRDNIVKKQTITQAKKVLDESPLCSLPLPICACCILLSCSLQVISLGTTSCLHRSRYATC